MTTPIERILRRHLNQNLARRVARDLSQDRAVRAFFLDESTRTRPDDPHDGISVLPLGPSAVAFLPADWR